MAADTVLLTGLADTRQALLALLESMRRNLRLYTPYLDPRLFDDDQVLDTLRGRLITQPRLQGYLLLPPAGAWRSTCPRLRQLSERLSTRLQVRSLPADEIQDRPEFGQGFVLTNDSGLLHLADPRSLSGSLTLQPSVRGRELLNFFIEFWEKSQPDPELRRLHL
jgi:hypothetical protein